MTNKINKVHIFSFVVQLCFSLLFIAMVLGCKEKRSYSDDVSSSLPDLESMEPGKIYTCKTDDGVHVSAFVSQNIQELDIGDALGAVGWKCAVAFISASDRATLERTSKEQYLNVDAARRSSCPITEYSYKDKDGNTITFFARSEVVLYDIEKQLGVDNIEKNVFTRYGYDNDKRSPHLMMRVQIVNNHEQQHMDDIQYFDPYLYTATSELGWEDALTSASYSKSSPEYQYAENMVEKLEKNFYERSVALESRATATQIKKHYDALNAKYPLGKSVVNKDKDVLAPFLMSSFGFKVPQFLYESADEKGRQKLVLLSNFHTLNAKIGSGLKLKQPNRATYKEAFLMYFDDKNFDYEKGMRDTEAALATLAKERCQLINDFMFHMHKHNYFWNESNNTVKHIHVEEDLSKEVSWYVWANRISQTMAAIDAPESEMEDTYKYLSELIYAPHVYVTEPLCETPMLNMSLYSYYNKKAKVDFCEQMIRLAEKNFYNNGVFLSAAYYVGSGSNIEPTYMFNALRYNVETKSKSSEYIAVMRTDESPDPFPGCIACTSPYIRWYVKHYEEEFKKFVAEYYQQCKKSAINEREGALQVIKDQCAAKPELRNELPEDVASLL